MDLVDFVYKPAVVYVATISSALHDCTCNFSEFLMSLPTHALKKFFKS